MEGDRTSSPDSQRSETRLRRIAIAIGSFGELIAAGGLSTRRREREETSALLTPELIQEETGYKLFASFPDFSESGRVSPDLHEERERLASEIGEDNVMPSMFIDETGKIALGLFTKEPESTK